MNPIIGVYTYLNHPLLRAKINAKTILERKKIFCQSVVSFKLNQILKLDLTFTFNLIYKDYHSL